MISKKIQYDPNRIFHRGFHRKIESDVSAIRNPSGIRAESVWIIWESCGGPKSLAQQKAESF